MKQLIKKVKQISILLLVISLIGCENDEILPEVIAGFTYTLNEDTGTVTFINTSVNSRNYFWTFGDETSSTEINPIKTYTETGSYIVSLKATDVSGASNIFQDTINILIKEAMSLPITFDDVAVKYDVAVFGGATFEIVDNPYVSGTNDKETEVGAVTNSGAQYEGINFDLGTPIDFTSDKTITINFWADSAVDVLMKLEEGTGSDKEVTMSHGGTGWEMVSFEFNSSGKYSRLTLFVDGPGTTSGTFYIDDIVQVKSAPVITLNGNNPLNVAIGGTFTDPGATAVDGYGIDISSSIITAGDTVDENTAGTYVITYNVSDEAGNAATEVTRTVIVADDFVAPVITLIGSATMNVEIGGTFTDPGATATDDVDGDITDSIVVAGDIVDVNTAATYIITYDVNDAAGNAATQVTRTVIVAVAGACIAETSESMSALDLNVTFMTDQTSSIIQDNATFEWLDNPDVDNALNGSCKVGKVTNHNVVPWDNIQIDLADKLTFTSGSNFTMKIYSPQSGYKVTIKLEDKTNAGINTQVASSSTTKTNEWEELTIPFGAGDSGKFDKIVIFFDLETQNGHTYYFDDLKLNEGDGGGGPGPGPGPGGELAENGDFETGTLDGWAVYLNGGSITVDNTQSSGGTFSAKMVADPNGLNPTLKQERKGAGSIVAGDQIQITFDYMGSLAGESGTFSMQSFVEATNGVNQVETFTVTPTATWQTFTTTYTVNAGDVSGGITMEFVAICGGVPGCESVLYLDNVSVKVNP